MPLPRVSIPALETAPSPGMKAFACISLAAFFGVSASCAAPTQRESAAEATYVLHISVDGLRPDAVTKLGAEQVPNFFRLRKEGAFTDNARTDPNSTETAPNHTCQLTSRPVRGEEGHGWSTNDSKPPAYTIHDNKGSYVPSVFDVVHDHGLRTTAIVSKPKLYIYKASYGTTTGAADTTGADNGTKKIDRIHQSSKAPENTTAFIKDFTKSPANYTFLHFQEPDRAGHDHRWNLDEGSAYMESVKVVDGELGRILAMLDSHPELRAKTTIILTADHGGLIGTKGHNAPNDPQAYTIPFYVWGAGVTPGDLYAMNKDDRQDPGTKRLDIGATPPPIRNGEAANLALDLLGLPAISKSTYNVQQNLDIGVAKR